MNGFRPHQSSQRCGLGFARDLLEKVFSIVAAAWVMSDCAACLSRGFAGLPPAFINYELQFDL